MKAINVDVTLTRAELEAPFRVPDNDIEPLDGPTRLALMIDEGEDAFHFEERAIGDLGIVVNREVVLKDNH